MDEKNTFPAFSIIPEFFFDLICRITPGIFFIGAILYEFNIVSIESFKNLNNQGSGFIVFIGFLLIIFGYNFGIFLSIPGKYIAKIYTKCVWKKNLPHEKNILLKFLIIHPLEDIEIFKTVDKKKEVNKKLKDSDYQRIYRETHDFLKNNDEQAKGILPKLSAEASLCNNSAASLAILLTIHYIHRNYTNVKLSSDLYGWWILIIIVLIWNGYERYQRLLKSLFSYLKIVINQKYAIDKTKHSRDQQITKFEKFKSALKDLL